MNNRELQFNILNLTCNGPLTLGIKMHHYPPLPLDSHRITCLDQTLKSKMFINRKPNTKLPQSKISKAILKIITSPTFPVAKNNIE